VAVLLDNFTRCVADEEKIVEAEKAAAGVLLCAAGVLLCDAVCCSVL